MSDPGSDWTWVLGNHKVETGGEVVCFVWVLVSAVTPGQSLSHPGPIVTVTGLLLTLRDILSTPSSRQAVGVIRQ